MSLVSVETCHITEEYADPALAELVKKTTTNDENELHRGAILAVVSDGKPVIGAAVGDNRVTARFWDVRNIYIAPSVIDDSDLVARGLKRLAQFIKEKAQLLHDGVVVDADTIGDKLPEGTVNAIIESQGIVVEDDQNPGGVVLDRFGLRTTGFAYTAEEVKSAIQPR